MKYKVLPNARLVITTDGSNQLLVDTGSKLIPLAASLDDSTAQKVIDTLAENGQIGYEKVERIIVLPETTAELAFIEDMGTYVAVLPAENAINSNDTLTVTWDGAKYTCVVFGDYSFGNAALFGEGEDTGEPFCGGVQVEEDGTAFAVLTASTPGTHVVSIEAKQKELLPMNPMWLPPIPNMENSIQVDSYAEKLTLLTDECSAEFNQIVAMNAPFFTARVRIGALPILLCSAVCRQPALI